jgi:hypothetical protein
MLEKQWEYSGAVCQQFIDFQSAYDFFFFGKKVVYNAPSECSIAMKLFRLIKMYK